MDNNSLYHYTRLSTFLEYILPTLSLKFNPIKATNDPYENKLSIGTFCKSSELITDNNLTQLHFQLDFTAATFNSEKVIKDFKVLCFSQSLKTKKGIIYGYNMPRMWAQYGDNHKGICIEFDKSKLISKVRKSLDPTYFSNVIYRNNSIPIEYDSERISTDDYLKNFLIKHRKEIFFTKNKDWVGEREFRFLIIGQTDYLVFLKKYIKGIYLGLNFNYKYYPLIRYYNAKYKLKIYQIYISGLSLYKGKYIEQL